MRWLTVIGLILIAGAAWWLWQVARLDPSEQSTATGFGQLALAVVGTLSMLADSVRKRFTPTPLPPVDSRADELAKIMLREWEKAIVERDLTSPLPTQWRKATRSVAVPVAETSAAFEPLPGATRATNNQLGNGAQSDLYDVYAGLPSGRLIITGRAGSGKTTAAILLLRDALRHRARAGAEDRARIPVPVMFTLHGWDPGSTPVKDWLAGKISEIPGFRKGAGDLLDDKRIAVFLDGLDEIDEELRASALRELSRQATFRLVLLSRDDELVNAVKQSALVGAVAIELRPLDSDVAADYLLSRLVSPSPAWRAVTDCLKNDPNSPAARTLKNPFMLTLLRDAYEATGPVDELLDRRRFRKATQIENHLLDRALEAAYTSGPERLPQRYSLHTARRTLGYIGHQLNQTGSHDLAWWTVPQWTARPGGMFLRGHAVVFAVAIPVGALLGLSYWLATGQPIITGLPIGLIAGYVCAFALLRRNIAPRRVLRRWWRAPFTAQGLVIGLPAGLGTALTLTLLDSTLPGIAGWLTTGLVAWLTFGIGMSLYTAMQEAVSSFDPRQSWRQDALAGLAFAVTTGLGAFVAGIGFGSRYHLGLPTVLAIGALGALAGAVWLWPATAAAWPVFCSQVQLTLQHRTPLRLMRFLEDARERQVLRTVGPVYQFRHAKLQDRLAAL